MTIRGAVHFNGTAPPNSQVRVVASNDGKIVARATADELGSWSVSSVDLPPGEHAFQAVAYGGNSSERRSAPISVTVEAEDSAVAASSHIDDLDESESLYWAMVNRIAMGGEIDGASCRRILDLALRTELQLNEDVQARCEERELEQLRGERKTEAEYRYLELVHAIADGFEVDEDTGQQILAASGRTIADVESDLGELRQMSIEQVRNALRWSAIDAMRSGGD